MRCAFAAYRVILLLLGDGLDVEGLEVHVGLDEVLLDGLLDLEQILLGHVQVVLQIRGQFILPVNRCWVKLGKY